MPNLEAVMKSLEQLHKKIDLLLKVNPEAQTDISDRKAKGAARRAAEAEANSGATPPVKKKKDH